MKKLIVVILSVVFCCIIYITERQFLNLKKFKDDRIIKKVITITFIITLSCIVYSAQQDSSKQDFIQQKKQEEQDGIFKVYGTDIVTYLNGYEIPCLVINDRVVVYASDMQYYGFDIESPESNKDIVWDISFNNKPITKDPNVTRSPTYLPNEYAGNAYKDDGISMNQDYSSDLKISYVFQEKTLIEIEELADTEFYPYYVLSNKETNNYKEYSHKGFYSEWDSENRVLKIESLRKGDKIKVMGGAFPLESIYTIDYYFRPSAKLTGSNKVDKISYFLDTSLMETYYELSTLLESLDIKYSFEDNILILEKETGNKKKVFIDKRDYENLSKFSRSFPELELRCSFNPEYKAYVLLINRSIYIKYSDIEELTGIKCKYVKKSEYVEGILEATY